MRVIYSIRRHGIRNGGKRSLILSLSDLCLSWEIVLITRQAKRNQKRGKSRDTRDFHRLLDLQEACNRVRIRVSYTSWRGGWLEWKHQVEYFDLVPDARTCISNVNTNEKNISTSSGTIFSTTWFLHIYILQKKEATIIVPNQLKKLNE